MAAVVMHRFSVLAAPSVRSQGTVLGGVFMPEDDEQNLLDNIEDQELLKLLLSLDKATLKILILKIEGYSCKEIANLINMKENTINQRIARLRKIF